MSRLKRIVKTVLVDKTTVVYECPRCGTNLTSTNRVCPNCNCDRVARYEID